MSKEIAVFLAADGSSASLNEPGKVAVFRRAQGAWALDREKEFFLDQVKGMRELRIKMEEILRFLNECKVFVASSATGVPYFELEKAGCGVWEITGKPGDFLEKVWEEEEKELALEKTQDTPCIPAPEETSPGDFFISIKEIQGKNADLSSKQILQQFIRNGGFRTLSIICSHVPPWIGVDAMRAGLDFEAEQLGKNEFKVKIIKK